MVSRRSLLAVHAHPDDESSKGAAALARYTDEGVHTVVVTCTGGEAGDILNPAMDRPGVLERMPELRREELARALEIIGIRGHHWLGYRDSGMPDSEANAHPEAFVNADLDEAVSRLVRVIRAERPQVVLCYDETGGYPHPDHIRDHEITTAAFDAAGDAGRYPGAGSPWQPLKLYYYASFTRQRLRVLHDELVNRDVESPFGQWLESWDENGRPEPVVTTRVHVGSWLARQRDALTAHRTQIDPNSFWFAVPDDVLARIYPWDDYTLARSLVEPTVQKRTQPGTPATVVEEDLFTGIGPDGTPLTPAAALTFGS